MTIYERYQNEKMNVGAYLYEAVCAERDEDWARAKEMWQKMREAEAKRDEYKSLLK